MIREKLRVLPKIAGVALLVFMGGCATSEPFNQPVVDMAGVDQTKFNSDISECNMRRVNGGFIQYGPVISNCMHDKGYKIIVYRS